MCVLMSLIILPAAEGQFDIMVSSYLPHAAPTPELKALVLAMIQRTNKVEPHRDFDHVYLCIYLAIIHQWVRSIKILHSTHTRVVNDVTMYTGLW